MNIYYFHIIYLDIFASTSNSSYPKLNSPGLSLNLVFLSAFLPISANCVTVYPGDKCGNLDITLVSFLPTQSPSPKDFSLLFLKSMFLLVSINTLLI